jgi:predicted phosphodiesterase
MTTIDQTFAGSQFGPLFENWHKIAHNQLDKAFHLSPHLSFDDTTRLAFFSDAHRGVNNRDDFFAPNAGLFYHALSHYFHEAFTFVEVGDGDELWHNHSFADIRRTYSKIFDRFAQFNRAGRLHLIVGNHDSPQGLFDATEKEGIPLTQGLRLTYAPTGQKLFAVHGHQADPDGDRHWETIRRQSRYFWQYLLRSGLARFYHFAEPELDLPDKPELLRLPRWFSDWALTKAVRLETAIKMWLEREKQIVISGHTHMVNFPGRGELPHFNTGHCTTPGYITGLEINDGVLAMVKWTDWDGAYTRTVLRQMPLGEVMG